jgi:hypothetical protein
MMDCQVTFLVDLNTTKLVPQSWWIVKSQVFLVDLNTTKLIPQSWWIVKSQVFLVDSP